jgi:hypothetical protein
MRLAKGGIAHLDSKQTTISLPIYTGMMLNVIGALASCRFYLKVAGDEARLGSNKNVARPDGLFGLSSSSAMTCQSQRGDLLVRRSSQNLSLLGSRGWWSTVLVIKVKDVGSFRTTFTYSDARGWRTVHRTIGRPWSTRWFLCFCCRTVLFLFRRRRIEQGFPPPSLFT